MLTNVNNEMAPACNEHFSPIAPVIAVSTTEEVHIIDQTLNDEPHIPFGGVKESGLGRYNAETILREFTREKWISIQHEPREFPP